MDTQLVDAIGQVVQRDDRVVEVRQSAGSLVGFSFLPLTVVLIKKRGVVLGATNNLFTESFEHFKQRYIKVPRRE